MVCALSVRRLKPGAYKGFLEAWRPEEWPEGSIRAYHVRAVDDEDLVVSFGLFDMTADELQDSFDEEREGRRQEAMAEHVESTIVDGLFEVADEVTPG